MDRVKTDSSEKTNPALRKAIRENYLESATHLNYGDYSGSKHELGVDPDPFVVTLPLYIQKSKLSVLDLGCGDGRNAIHLAERGYSVTAIDNSVKAIAILRRDAQARGVRLEAIPASIVSNKIRGSFDVVLMIRVLHELMHEEALKLIDSAKKHTSPGGLNVVQVITSSALSGLFYRKDTLPERYRDWNPKFYATGRTHDGYPEAHIIAQKP